MRIFQPAPHAHATQPVANRTCRLIAPTLTAREGGDELLALLEGKAHDIHHAFGARVERRYALVVGRLQSVWVSMTHVPLSNFMRQ